MKTIHAVVNVGDDRRLTMILPLDISPGEHTVVLVIDESRPSVPPSTSMNDFPSHDVGPWPEGFTASREEIYGDDGR
jgi:hypothetical protein